MTTYVVLLPGDESVWENATEEHRSAVYARHGEFSRALEERGHTITGGAELEHSREAKVVRRTASGTVVTDGPYAETVEQLSGYYVVETDDLDDLLEVCGILADGDGPVEVRACLGGADGPTS
ncbi:YciI family protein [Nocardioides caricicola]|uniref:YciI family protein n=1 Tax=Nocardioides caricicola TaxID=634770 RepID=A0ABW0MXJ6_9ACTN